MLDAVEGLTPRSARVRLPAPPRLAVLLETRAATAISTTTSSGAVRGAVLRCRPRRRRGSRRPMRRTVHGPVGRLIRPDYSGILASPIPQLKAAMALLGQPGGAWGGPSAAADATRRRSPSWRTSSARPGSTRLTGEGLSGAAGPPRAGPQGTRSSRRRGGRQLASIAARHDAAPLPSSPPGVAVLRSHPVTGTPRGPLCGMGVCLECDVTVDGRTGTRACLTRVSDGMRIQTGSAGSAT